MVSELEFQFASVLGILMMIFHVYSVVFISTVKVILNIKAHKAFLCNVIQ